MTIARAHRTTLRLALAAATFAVAGFAGSLVSADQAQAAGYDPNFPYCVKGPYYPLECTHVSLAECRFTAQGLGYCFANPFYAGPPANAPYARHRHRH